MQEGIENRGQYKILPLIGVSGRFIKIWFLNPSADYPRALLKPQGEVTKPEVTEYRAKGKAGLARVDGSHFTLSVSPNSTDG